MSISQQSVRITFLETLQKYCMHKKIQNEGFDVALIESCSLTRSKWWSINNSFCSLC